MDTIDSNTMAAVMIAIEDLVSGHVPDTKHRPRRIDTVTVTLNGEHGGVDVLVEGYATMNVSTYERHTWKLVVK